MCERGQLGRKKDVQTWSQTPFCGKIMRYGHCGALHVVCGLVLTMDTCSDFHVWHGQSFHPPDWLYHFPGLSPGLARSTCTAIASHWASSTDTFIVHCQFNGTHVDNGWLYCTVTMVVTKMLTKQRSLCWNSWVGTNPSRSVIAFSMHSTSSAPLIS